MSTILSIWLFGYGISLLIMSQAEGRLLDGIREMGLPKLLFLNVFWPAILVSAMRRKS